MLNLPSGCEGQVYERLVSEVDRACRNESQRPMLEVLRDPDRLDHRSQVAELIAAKTVTRGRLLSAVTAESQSVGTTVKLRDEPTPPVRLPLKLERGGFGPTAISVARMQRINWIAHRRQWAPDLPAGEDKFAAAEGLVLKAAGSAERAALGCGEEPYGQIMLDELQKELAKGAVPVPGNLSPDLDLLLGCAYDLTDGCHIWWSDKFEIGVDQ